MNDPPEEPGTELTAAIARGVVSAIPIVGGLFAEVGSVYLDPLKKRQQEWLKEVASTLREINSRFSRLPAELAQDEHFSSILLQATAQAMHTHQRAKLNALRSAIVAGADPTRIRGDLDFTFLRYVDDLSATHLRILSHLEINAQELTQTDNMALLYQSVVRWLGEDLPRDQFRSCLQDLRSRFLIHEGDIAELPEYDSTVQYRAVGNPEKRYLTVTSIGKTFIAWIGTSAQERNSDTSDVR